jgi:asparagine synthase (glutamine-hydrolysing)
MCGIAAIIQKEKSDQGKISSMLNAIKHRGDTQPNFMMVGNAALGSVRLQIIDQSHGEQPIYNETGTMAIVFNGEIYNYKALKAELETLGHIFKTDCDTEVLIHLFEENGCRMLNKLDGMFAFVIYNKQKNTFFAARDYFGVKPLYFCENENAIYFSSELKSFLTLSVEEFKEIPPASYMDNTGIHTYYTYNTTLDTTLDFPTASLVVKHLTEESVKKRVQTDLPIGVFLSGGLDSTIVFLLCLKYHSNVIAIIIGDDDAQDVIHALRLCHENNYKYQHIKISKNQLLETIPIIVDCIETFEINPVRGAALSYYLSKAANDLGLKIILCGEGSDEIFAGYGDFLKATSEPEFEQITLNFLSYLYRTQLLRIDKTGMAFGVEVREPFMDKALVEYALKLPTEFKIKTDDNGKTITKHILREAFKDILPHYIFIRDKMTLMEGAGAGPVNKEEGMFYENALGLMSDEHFHELIQKYPEYKIENKEVAFYFEFFRRKYLRAKFSANRTFNATMEIKTINDFN